MSGHEHESRRSGATPADGSVRGPVVPQHQVLALQRSAGNRAVQRLVWTQNSQLLRVPKSYADQKLPWEGDHVNSGRAATEGDQTFLQIANLKKEHLTFIAAGINVPKVAGVVAVLDDKLLAGADTLTGKNAADGTKDKLKEVMPAADQVMVYPGPPTQYFDPGDVEAHMILKPEHFFPEASDLPAAGVKVRDQIPGAMKGQLLWNLVCVLIALIKADGHANVKALTGTTTSTLDEGVQALHDHYKTQGVEYDDTSSRFRVMKDWGYKPIFSGKARWTDLPRHVALPRGHYIFDITGHTVMVDVLQDIPKGPALATTTGFFKANSDKDNYKVSEFTKDVEYIWAK